MVGAISGDRTAGLEQLKQKVTRGAGEITSDFGAERGKTDHTGIDIAVETGTKIFAPFSGTIVAAEDSGDGYGKRVDIKNDQTGEVVRLAHNSQLQVSTGQQISEGQEVADSGSTGKSTGPHSHVMVYKNEEDARAYRNSAAIDPVQAIAQRNQTTPIAQA